MERRNSSWCSGLGATWPTRSGQGTAKVPWPLGETGPCWGQNHGFLISARSLGEVSDYNSFSKENNFQLPCGLLAWKLTEQNGPTQGDSWESGFEVPGCYCRRFYWESRPVGGAVYTSRPVPLGVGGDQAGEGAARRNPPTTPDFFCCRCLDC